MLNNFVVFKTGKPNINDTEYEVVERKGIGHPDNLCDAVAEKISVAYSTYCLDKYGVILRHMVDKVAVLGGSSKVSFGQGEMTSPIRILLNGRFTHIFLDEEIDYMKIVNNVVKDHFKNIFPLLDTDKWLKIIDNTHFSQGPGVVYNKDGTTKNERSQFFSVSDEKYIKHHSNGFRSNDTSTTVSYFPLSDLENMVIISEGLLDNAKFKKSHQYVGTDIKVMGKRVSKNIELTLCIPFIAEFTPDQGFYIQKLNELKELLINMLKREFPTYSIDIILNTRDNFDNQDIYLTAIGSAVESGDEGAVGRGNRSNGIIPFTRNMSSEAPCGKNPVYHTGKIFTVIGDIIAEEIFKTLGIESTVYLTSQMGRDMNDPWQAAIALDGYQKDIDEELRMSISNIVEENLIKHSEITNKIVSGQIKIYEPKINLSVFREVMSSAA